MPTDRDYLIGAMMGEAAGQGEQGMAAVADVLTNRMKNATPTIYGSPPPGVAANTYQGQYLARSGGTPQFSSAYNDAARAEGSGAAYLNFFNSLYNKQAFANNPDYAMAQRIADSYLDPNSANYGQYAGIARGADYFVNSKLAPNSWAASQPWGQANRFDIGDHTFMGQKPLLPEWTGPGSNIPIPPSRPADIGTPAASPTKVDPTSVMSLYASMLGRQADDQGLGHWVNSGMSLADIAKGFEGSSEYTSLHHGGNAEFVDDLYQNALGRHAEAGGLQGWTDMLNHGATRGDIAAGIAGSDEARNFAQSTLGYQFNPTAGDPFSFSHSSPGSLQPDYMYSPDQRTIASMYAAALGRAPDQAGLDSWTKMHDGGTSWADIAHQIGGSQEAIDRTGGWNNAQFVDGLYHSTLGRDADEPGLMNWTKMLDDGTVTRSDLDYSFASSPEAQNFQQSTQGYTHPQGVDVGAFSFSSMDPSRFSTLDNVDYGQGFAAYTPPPPSPTGNAWSDSYAATNAITNAEIAKANQQTEQLMNSSTAAQNQMLANQQAVGAQQQQQFNQNIANTNATQFGPAPVGQLPQLMPFNPSPVPVFPNIGPSFL